MRSSFTSTLVAVLLLVNIFIGLPFLPNASVQGAERIDGPIATDTTLTLANSPYYIEDDVLVQNGVVLTIDPGVVVKFNGNYKLTINGTLNAAGASNARITFTSNHTDPLHGDWDSIFVARNGHLNMQWVILWYADTAVHLGATQDVVLTDTSFRDSNVGLYAWNVNHTFFDGNEFRECDVQMDLHYSDNNTINDTRFSSSGQGLLLRDSWGNQIRNNDFPINDSVGIRVNPGYENTIENNTFTGANHTRGQGIEVTSNSRDNNVQYNFFIGMNIGFSCQNTNPSSSNMKFPVQYNEFQWAAFGIQGVSCSGYRFYKNTFSHDEHGIQLQGASSGNDIDNNTVADSAHGFTIQASTENDVINNVMVGNSSTIAGVEILLASRQNRISFNTITNWKGHGIFLQDSISNEVQYNKLIKNEVAVGIQRGSTNTVFENQIKDSEEVGVELTQTSSNRIFHNNFETNAVQATNGVGTSDWDDGYPSGGNYWDDYNGNDQRSGANQLQPGSDEIGDSAYFIDATTRDRYPLMAPWDSPPSSGPSSRITQDTTWTLANSPYYIDSNVYIDQNVTLTIQSGVEVRFNGYYSFFIEGNLRTTGNETNYVIFTSNRSGRIINPPNVGDWNKLQVNDTGNIDLSYTRIEYAYIAVQMYSDSNVLFHCNLSFNYYGVRAFESDYNLFQDNNFTQIQWGALELGNSRNNEVDHNEFWNNDNGAIDVWGMEEDYNHIIRTNNKVQTRTVYYYYGASDVTFSSGTPGHVTYASSERINIDGITLLEGSDPITFAYTSQSQVQNCNFVNLSYAIELLESDNITVRSNDISRADWGTAILSNSSFIRVSNNIYNNTEYGVFISDSDDVEVYNNDFIYLSNYGVTLFDGNRINIHHNTLDGGYYGIYLSNSVDGLVQSNTISDYSSTGITLMRETSYDASDNIISHNNVQDCTQAIFLDYDTRDNIVHHNNFIRNGIQADDYEDNSWDDGANGNYWTDYSSADRNGDGIGDEPYVIDDDSKDRYPAMAAWANPGYKDTVPPSPVNNLIVANSTSTYVELKWTTSGDDAMGGLASKYVVKYRTTGPILTELAWATATEYDQSWVPIAPGLNETRRLTDLNPNTPYWFSIKVLDEVPNNSSLSNSPNSMTEIIDVIRPGQIFPLSTFNPSSRSVDLRWTATGDDGTLGTADKYEVRYCDNSGFNVNCPIYTATAWNVADEFDQTWNPRAQGEQETHTVDGLDTDTDYCFAIKAVDEAGNIAIFNFDSPCMSTLVPGEGQPVHNWERNEHYDSIQDAINDAEAHGWSGDHIAVDDHIYREVITIPLPLFIDGESQGGTILESREFWDYTILIQANGVVIQNLTLKRINADEDDDLAATTGIVMDGTVSTRLENLTLREYHYGVGMYKSTGTYMRHVEMNEIWRHAFDFDSVNSPTYYDHDIDSSNRFQGRDIKYFFERTTPTQYNSMVAGTLILAYSSNQEFRELNMVIADQILLVGSDYNSFTGVNLERYKEYKQEWGTYGVHVIESHNNFFNWLNISDYADGIYNHNSNSNIYLNSNSSFNTVGLYIYGNSITVQNCGFYNNDHYGLKISTSSNDLTIDTSNVVNGRPVYYYEDPVGITIENIVAGHFTVINGDGLTIRNVKVINGDGINMPGLTSSHVSNINASGRNGISITLSTDSYYEFLYAYSNRGDGIHLQYISQNTVFRNLSSSYNKQGVVVSSSSIHLDNVRTAQNTIVGITLYYSDVTLTDAISRNNPIGLNIFLVDDSVFDNIQIIGSTFIGLKIENSDGNELRNIIIQTGTSDGLNLYGSDDNQFTYLSITGADYNIQSYRSDRNIVYNSTLSGAHERDVSMSGDGDLALINTSFNPASIQFSDPDPNLLIGYFLDVRVRDSVGNAIPGAQVIVKDKTAATKHDVLTDSKGMVSSLEVIYQLRRQSGTIDYSPHNVEVKSSGYTNATSVTMSENRYMEMWLAYEQIYTVHNPARGTHYYTIQSAVDDLEANAWAGDVLEVDDGVHWGDVIITSPITLIGQSRDGTILEDVVLYIQSTENVSIQNMTLQRTNADGYTYGIESHYVTNISLERLNIRNHDVGVYFYETDNGLLDQLDMSRTGDTLSTHGINLYNSDNNEISNIDFSRYGYGIYLYASHNNNIHNGTAHSIRGSYGYFSGDGIYISSSDYTTVRDFNVSGFGTGFYTSSSSDHTSFRNMNVSGNNFGATLSGSFNLLEDCIFSNNEARNLDIGYNGPSIINQSNLINGMPIHYYFNVNGLSLSNIVIGHLTIYDSENITISDVDILDADGAKFMNISNSLISNLNSTRNYLGVYANLKDYIGVFDSENVTFQNIQTYNNIYNGFFLSADSSSILLDGLHSAGNGRTGLQMSGEHFSARNIAVSNNTRYGLYVFSSRGGLTIEDVVAQNNREYGISFSSMDGATAQRITILDQPYFSNGLGLQYCDNNLFKDISISNGGYTGLLAYYPQNNIFEDLTIQGYRSTLTISSRLSYGSNTITNSSLGTGVESNITLASGASIDFINTTAEYDQTLFSVPDSKLTVSHYLDIYVYDSLGFRIPGAQVMVNDTFGANLYTTTTDNDGWIRDLIAVGMTMNSTGTYHQTPHNVRASYAGESSSSAVTMDQKRVVSIQLNVVQDMTKPAAITDLWAGEATETTMNLTWSAPGDDNLTGDANSYMVRYSSEGPIDSEANWTASTVFVQSWVPVGVNLTEDRMVTGLVHDTTYWFAVRASDELDNLGNLSNSPFNTTVLADLIPPGAITALVADGPTQNSANLTWTAPGDDGQLGNASSYLVRFSSNGPIDDQPAWDAATDYIQSWVPLEQGQTETRTITGLNPMTTYWFSVRANDEVPNTADLSNSPSTATDSVPGLIRNLDQMTDHPTIQDAIDNANSGDRILVTRGTYTENVVIDKQVILIGEGSGVVSLDAASSTDPALTATSSFTASGFSVGGGSHGLEVIGVSATLADMSLSGSGNGLKAKGAAVVSLEDGLIWSTGSHALYLTDTSSATLVRVGIPQAGLSAIFLTSFSGGITVLMENCTISAAPQTDIVMDYAVAPHVITMINTTFDKSDVSIRASTSSSITLLWYLHFHAEDLAGNPMDGKNYWVNDTDSNVIQQGVIGENGDVAWVLAEEYTQDINGIVSSTPHKVTIKRRDVHGFTSVTMDQNKQVTVILSVDTTPSGPVWNDEQDKYYDTIQEAVDDAQVHGFKGEHIYVAAGIYNESVIINKTVYLLGDGSDVTYLDDIPLGYGFFIDAGGADVTISGFSINGTQIGVHVNDSDPISYIVIENNEFTNLSRAIESVGNTNFTLLQISYNTFMYNQYGIYGADYAYSGGFSVYRNSFSFNQNDMYFRNISEGNNLFIRNNSALLTTDTSLHIEDVLQATVEGNIIESSGLFGAKFVNMEFLIMDSNTFGGITQLDNCRNFTANLTQVYEGLVLTNSYNITFRDLELFHPMLRGIMLTGSHNNTFINVTFDNGYGNGIVVLNSDNNTFDQGHMQDVDTGFTITNGRNNTFTNIDIHSANTGIKLNTGAEYNTFNEILIAHQSHVADVLVHLDGANHNTIMNINQGHLSDTVGWADQAIVLTNSQFNYFEEMNAHPSFTGINLTNSHNNTFHGMYFRSHFETTIWIDDSNWNVLTTGKVMDSVEKGIVVRNSDFNLVALFIFQNINHTFLEVQNSNNNTFGSISVATSEYGIRFSDSHHNGVWQVYIQGLVDEDAIYLHNSDNNWINTFTVAGAWLGAHLETSDNNLLYNLWMGDIIHMGLFLDASTGNEIDGLQVEGAEYGAFSITPAKGNTIRNVELTNCQRGIWLVGASGDVVYGGTIENTTENPIRLIQSDNVTVGGLTLRNNPSAAVMLVQSPDIRFDRLHITDSPEAFNLDNLSSGLKIYNSSLEAVVLDLNIPAGMLIQLINSTFDSAKVLFGDWNSEYQVFWLLDVLVNNNVGEPNQAPIGNAEIRIRNRFNTQVYQCFTNSLGFSMYIELMEYRLNGTLSQPHYFTPHGLKVTYGGKTKDISPPLYMDHSQFHEVIMEEDRPVVQDLKLTYDTLINRTQRQEFFLNVSDIQTPEDVLNVSITLLMPDGNITYIMLNYTGGGAPKGYWFGNIIFNKTALIGNYTVNVTVTDEALAQGWFETLLVVANNLPVAFNLPPLYNDTVPDLTVPEDSPISVDLNNSKSDIEDESENLTWYVHDFDPLAIAYYDVDQQNGTFVFYPVQDNDGLTTVVMRLNDTDNGSVLVNMVLNWTSINDAPYLIGSVINFTLVEDTKNDTVINMSHLFFDPDNVSLQYSVISVLYPGSLIVIDPNNTTGQTITSSALNRSGNDTLIVCVTDGLTAPVCTIPFNATILARNDPPEVLNYTIFINMTEDVPLVFDLGIMFYDSDSWPLFYDYQITDFSIHIDPLTNLTTLISPSNWSGEIRIRYYATDRLSPPILGELVITVLPVNDGPYLKHHPGTIVLTEDIPEVVFNIYDAFIDSDSGTLATEAWPETPGTVMIDITTAGDGGNVIITPVTNWFGSVQVHINITDGSLNSTVTFWVVVMPVNDEPAVTGDIPHFTMIEDGLSNHINLYHHFNDVDNATIYFWSEVTEGIFDIEILTNGSVMIVPGNNWTGEGRIRFYANDNRALEGAAFTLLWITVVPVNDEPWAGTIPSTFTLKEDSTDRFLIKLSDYLYDAEDLVLTYQAFVLVNGSRVDATIEEDIYLGLATSQTDGENWSGEVLIKVSATDSLGVKVTSNAFVVIVSPVNDAPWLDPLPDVRLNEDTDLDWLNLSSYAHDVDTPLDELEYEIFSQTNYQNIVAMIDSNSQLKILTTTENYAGSSLVTVLVEDSDGLSTKMSFTVHVDAVNDAPIAKVLAPMVASQYMTGEDINFRSGSYDLDGDVLTYLWEFGDGESSVLDSTIYTYTKEGTYSVRLTVTDPSQASSSVTVSILVRRDLDQDGIPDHQDPDADGDGVPNTQDAFPFNGNEWADFDEDGIGNNEDEDDDNDGVNDIVDAYPLDSARSTELGGGPDWTALAMAALLLLLILVLAVVALRQRGAVDTPTLDSEHMHFVRCPSCQQSFYLQGDEGKIECPFCGSLSRRIG